MKCPLCGDSHDRVIDSRVFSDGTAVRRRRECNKCGYRFTSYERVEEKPLIVLKRSGRREPFDREKLTRGLQRALEKRNASPEEIDTMVHEIEEEAMRRGREGNEIDSTVLGEMVLERLFELDLVAYIRFASVYRKFSNLEEFISEIRALGPEKKSHRKTGGQ